MAQKTQKKEEPLLIEEHSEIENKSIPEDIFSNEMPKEETLPLEDKVAENPYATIPDVKDETTTNSPPETFKEQPSLNEISDPQPSPLPIQKPKSEEEIKTQADLSVNLMLRGYEKLHTLGRSLGKISQSRLADLEMSGKINLETEFLIGSKKVTARGFFAAHNKGIDETIVVTDDFKDAIRPPLTRTVIKHKWFVSDEMACILLIADDLTSKVSLMIGLQKAANSVLSACMEMMRRQNDKSEKTKEPPVANSQGSAENKSDEKAVEWEEPDNKGME